MVDSFLVLTILKITRHLENLRLVLDPCDQATRKKVKAEQKVMGQKSFSGSEITLNFVFSCFYISVIPKLSPEFHSFIRL
jgi:hypothetical protein